MSIDQQYIVNKIRFLVKEPSPAFWTSGDIGQAVNDAFVQIAREINYPKVDYSTYMASGDYSVTMPSGFLKIDPDTQITYKDNSNTYELIPLSQIDIGRATILIASPGTPQNIYPISESKIGVYPPSTSGCLVLPYIKKPTSLSSNTDTNELTEDCYMAAVYHVVKEAFLKDNDERALDYYKQYNEEIYKIKGNYESRFGVFLGIKPNKNYARGFYR